MERIICFGGGYKDFAIYIALTLNNMGYAVMMNDRSESRELACVISYNDFSGEIITYRNIDFCFGQTVLTDYDYVISYFSEYSDDLMEGGYQSMIINTQLCRSQLDISRRVIEGSGGNVILVFRDVAGSYTDRRYVERYLVDMSALIGVYEIRLDACDKAYQYKLDYEGIGRIRHISEDYEKAVVKCLCHVTGGDKRSIRRALKYVKEGKVFDNRLLE